MLNKKAYILTETLIVTTFLIGLFTFIYISIIPLTGKYEDKVQRLSDIDVVYKLYHLRKYVQKNNLMFEDSVKKITCDDLEMNCKNLLASLELNNYDLLYVDGVKNNYQYLTKNYHLLVNNLDKNNIDKVLILIDNDKNTFAILKYL